MRGINITIPNKKLLCGILIVVITIMGIGLFMYLSKPTITPSPKGQITVKQSSGAGLLIAECVEKSYVTETADYIIEGTVERVENRWDEEKTSIFTYTDLKIEKYVKGTPFTEDKLQIVTPGGTVGEISQEVEDQPIFHEGKKVRIYFQKTNGEFSIVCAQFGVEEPPPPPPEGKFQTITLSPELKLKAKDKYKISEPVEFELIPQKEVFVLKSKCERPFEIFDVEKGQNLAIHACPISGAQECQDGKLIEGPLYELPLPICEKLGTQKLNWDQKAHFRETAWCGAKEYTKYVWESVGPGKYHLVFSYYLGKEGEIEECQGEVKTAKWEFEIGE